MKGMRALFYFGLALACVVSAMASTRIERDISIDGGNSTEPTVTAVAPESIIGTKVVTVAAVVTNATVLKKHMAHANVDQKVMAQKAAKEEEHKFNNGARKPADKAYVPTTVHPTHGSRTVGSNKPRRNQLDMPHPTVTYNSADRHEDNANAERSAPAEYGLKPLNAEEFDGAINILKSDPDQNTEGAVSETKGANNYYLAQKYVQERVQNEMHFLAGVLNAINKDTDADRTHIQLRRDVLDASRFDRVRDFEKKLMQHDLRMTEHDILLCIIRKCQKLTELILKARKLADLMEQMFAQDVALSSDLRAEPNADENYDEDILDPANESTNFDEVFDEVAQSLMDTGGYEEQLMKLLSTALRLEERTKANNKGIVSSSHEESLKLNNQTKAN